MGFFMSMVINMGLLFLALLVLISLFNKKGGHLFESPQKRAGNEGEAIATEVIKGIMREDDELLTNVELNYNGKRTELDDLIVNENGIFIVEVKNYVGEMFGSADDYEWRKVKNDGYGNEFEKMVRNPIKQVKRQEFILANVLKQHGLNVWVQGYVYFVNHNSPVKDNCVLDDDMDISIAIHSDYGRHLNPATVERIKTILGRMAA